MTPALREVYSRPVFSWMGNASMSPRRATTGAPWSRLAKRATTPVPATRLISLGPNAPNAASSRLAVRSSWKASSGSRWISRRSSMRVLVASGEKRFSMFGGSIMRSVTEHTARAKHRLDEVVVGVDEPNVDLDVLRPLSDRMLQHRGVRRARGEVVGRQLREHSHCGFSIALRPRSIRPARQIEQPRRGDRGRRCIALDIRDRGMLEVPVRDCVGREVVDEEIGGPLGSDEDFLVLRPSKDGGEPMDCPRLPSRPG